LKFSNFIQSILLTENVYILNVYVSNSVLVWSGSSSG